jgi:hypothetical protein
MLAASTDYLDYEVAGHIDPLATERRPTVCAHRQVKLIRNLKYHHAEIVMLLIERPLGRIR